MSSTPGRSQSSSEKAQSSSAGQRQNHQPHYVSDASSGQRQRSRSSTAQQSRTKRQRKPPKGPVRKWLIPAVSLTAWMVVSSVVILLNKRILVEDGFSYPLTLSALGQFASALAGLLVSKLGWMQLGPAPSTRFFCTRLLPIVACAAGSLYLGNLAYLSLSVAFIQILKVLTPALTLIVTLCFGLERFSWPLALSVTLMSGGTAAATVVETGMPGFAWQGFAAFMLSASFESVRVVLIQLLLGQLQYNAVEILVYLGPPTGILLIISAAYYEQEALFGSGLSLIAGKPVLYAAAILLGVGVNLTTAVAIKATSSLTFKVFGCIKNTLVVVVGVLLGDSLAAEQMLGYAVSVAGFGLYTYAKQQQQAQEHRRSPKKTQ